MRFVGWGAGAIGAVALLSLWAFGEATPGTIVGAWAVLVGVAVYLAVTRLLHSSKPSVRLLSAVTSSVIALAPVAVDLYHMHMYMVRTGKDGDVIAGGILLFLCAPAVLVLATAFGAGVGQRR